MKRFVVPDHIIIFHAGFTHRIVENHLIWDGDIIIGIMIATGGWTFLGNSQTLHGLHNFHNRLGGRGRG
jgi:hypothetical protein